MPVNPGLGQYFLDRFVIRRDEIFLLCTGFLATLSSIGLARFAYTALMPQLVLSDWFSGEQAAYLGAANLLGYLVGALTASYCAERLGTLRVLHLCLWAVTLSFAASSWPQSMAVFSALIVPSMLHWGLSTVWLALAAAAALTALGGYYCARRIPAPQPIVITVQPGAAPAPRAALWTLAIGLVMLAYMLDGFGFVPHTVFWVDYLRRELVLGDAYSATQWAVFGLGAMIGPLAVAFCATRWGWRRTVVLGYAIKACAIGLPLVWGGALGHSLSGFAVGALSPGMAAVTSGYLMYLVGAAQHKKMWGYATAAFALMQATAGYTMAWIYAQVGSYAPLFLIGCCALTASTLLVLCARPRTAAP